MLSAEKRTTGKQERCCHECGGPIREGEDHAVMEVYDSPWGPPVEIAVHADNADNPWDTCESRLTDTEWAGFRYFDCDCCGRRICRQSRSNGWHSHVRVYRGREICLRCFRGIQLWEGASRESFESGRIEGMYYANGDLTTSGFEPVSGFFGYEIKDEDALKNILRRRPGADRAGACDRQRVRPHENRGPGGLRDHVEKGKGGLGP